MPKPPEISLREHVRRYSQKGNRYETENIEYLERLGNVTERFDGDRAETRLTKGLFVKDRFTNEWIRLRDEFTRSDFDVNYACFDLGLSDAIHYSRRFEWHPVMKHIQRNWRKM